MSRDMCIERLCRRSVAPTRFSITTLCCIASLLFLLSITSTASAEVDSSSTTSSTPTPTTVFVIAGSGEYSEAHELGLLYAAMEERAALSAPYCHSTYLGYLTHADGHRFRALAVTTGIGYVSTTVCMQQVLALQQAEGLAFTAVVLIGTSAFSPLVGGWDPTNTSIGATYAHGPREDAENVGGSKRQEDRVHHAAQVFTRTPHKYRTTAERDWDSAHDVLLAAQWGRQAGNGLRAVNGITGNVNWERVVSQRQLGADGCSPMRRRCGGDDECDTDSALSPLKASKPLSVGSICVTSAAFLQESGYCTEALSTNQCSRPHCFHFLHMMGARNIHVARGAGSEKLAADILAASAGKPFPELPKTVRAGMATYWRRNDALATTRGSSEERESGKGLAEAEEAVVPTPIFVDCAESTINSIVSGAERDYLCREYTAAVLNIAWHARRQQHGEERGDEDVDAKEGSGARYVERRAARAGPVTADTVVCVQAMEGFGFLESMSAYPDIPVAVIRTASSYDMYPQQKLYVPRRSVTGHPDGCSGESDEEDEVDPVRPYVWRQNTQYVSQAEHDKFMAASLHYSVKTMMFVVSNYFLGGRDLSHLTPTH